MWDHNISHIYARVLRRMWSPTLGCMASVWWPGRGGRSTRPGWARTWGRRGWPGGGGYGLGEEGMAWGRRGWPGGGDDGLGVEGMACGRRGWLRGGGDGLGWSGTGLFSGAISSYIMEPADGESLKEDRRRNQIMKHTRNSCQLFCVLDLRDSNTKYHILTWR